MNLKKILITFGILILVLIMVGLIVSYVGYLKMKKNVDTRDITYKNYFPFGPGNILNRTNQYIPGPTIQPNNQNIKNDEPNKKLIKVSDEPVAGYTFIQKEYFPDSTITTTNTPLTVTVTPRGTFDTELKYGSKGEAVKRLQQTLNDCPELGLATTGPGSKGLETEVFVERTLSAVKRFQEKFRADILTPQKLVEPTGILDELTRKKLSSPFVCKTQPANSPKTKPGGVLKTVVRYVEKATGNVYDFLPENKETGRLTNQTIPRIQEASFGDNGNKLFMRYLKDDNQTIETYFATVPKAILGGDGAEGELTGKFLQRNIIDLVLNPKRDIAFFQTVSGTNAIGASFKLIDESRNQFFTSPFSEWLPQWPNEKTITMTTKASGFVKGFMFNLDTKTGEMKKVLSDIYGLTTNTNPDITKILFSKSSDRSLVFGMHDIKDGKNYSLNVNTLPEKCAWSPTGGTIYCGVPRILPGGVYPDDWYQGTIHTSDQIVRIDPTQLYDNEILVDPEDEGVRIDVMNIQTDSNERYTAFIDKTTNILYMVNN
jgi:peptidoglycan hydrolase-like protein with peptidoglycan-binding domain